MICYIINLQKCRPDTNFRWFLKLSQRPRWCNQWLNISALYPEVPDSRSDGGWGGVGAHPTNVSQLQMCVSLQYSLDWRILIPDTRASLFLLRILTSNFRSEIIFFHFSPSYKFSFFFYLLTSFDFFFTSLRRSGWISENTLLHA